MANTLKDLIRIFTERGGLYQICLIFLLCVNSVTVGINHTITAFHIYVPEYFCRDDPPKTCGVWINGTECPSGYSFDESDDRTVVVEWSLVCHDRMLAPLVNTLYFVGVTLGALICSTLCDVYGRKKLVLVCLYGHILMTIGLYFAPTLEVFMVFRMLQGFFIQGLQTCSYTLMLEYCPSRLRTAAATFWESSWAIGLMFLGGASFFVRDWRNLNFVVAIPALISVAYSWKFPESISWLYTKSRESEAFVLMYKIARFNKSQDMLDKMDEYVSEGQHDELEIATNGYGRDKTNDLAESDGEKAGGLFSIIRSRVLRKHLLSMTSIWFSVTLSYYGILYFLPNLAGDRHANFLVGAGIELIAYVLTYFILLRFGRRIPMTLFQYTNGALCLLLGVLSMLDESLAKEWALVSISLVAKGLAVASFCGMFVYCSELFPTICRGLGLGLCGFSARVGSLLAPQLMALIYYAPMWLPLSIISFFLILTATTTIFLPETLSSRLPNTIVEADQMWGKLK